MILRVLRPVFAPTLEFPVFRHDFEVAVPSHLADFHSALIKERSRSHTHKIVFVFNGL